MKVEKVYTSNSLDMMLYKNGFIRENKPEASNEETETTFKDILDIETIKLDKREEFK